MKPLAEMIMTLLLAATAWASPGAPKAQETVDPGIRVAGRVTDTEGRTVARAGIGWQQERLGRIDVRTDEDGSFELAGLSPGLLKVTVDPIVGIADPVLLELKSGGTYQVDIRLRPPTVVRGQVVDPDGEPVEAAGITFRRPVGLELPELWKLPDRPGPGAFRSRSTESDEDGRFELRGLAPGHYRVKAHHPDFQWVWEIVEVVEGQVPELRLVLRERPRLPRVSGRVVSDLGEEIADASVLLIRRSPDSLLWGSVAVAQSDEDGLFELEAPYPFDAYVLQVSHEVFAGARIPVEVTSNGLEGMVVELGPGGVIHGEIRGLGAEQRTEVRVHASIDGGSHGGRAGGVREDGRYRLPGLRAGDWTVTASDRTGRRTTGRAAVEGDGDDVKLDLEFAECHRLRGKVSVDGSPLPKAGVSLHCFSCSGTASRSLTRDDGSFEIGPAAGSCRLSISAESPRAYWAGTVVLTDDQDLAVELATATFSGTLVSAADLRPLAGEEVFFGRARVTTDEEGRFRFPPMTPGRWALYVFAEGHLELSTEIELDGSMTDERILLDPGASQVFYVRTAEGKVPVAVEITQRQGGERSALLARPEPDGRIELRSLIPGLSELSFQDTEGRVARLEVEIPGADLEVILDFVPSVPSR